METYKNYNNINGFSGGVSSIYKNPMKKGFQDLTILIGAFGIMFGFIIYVKKISIKIPNYIKNLLLKKVYG